MPSNNITLYAKWTLTIYDVTFYTWDEQLIIVSGVGDYFEDDEALPPPTRTGYTFIGWFDADDNEWRDEDQLTEDISVYATYEANEYTITFNSNNGSARLPITQDYGTAVTEPIDPSKQGYTFSGWYTEVELTNLYEFTTMGASNITLYAKWVLISYEISFYTWDNDLILTDTQDNINGFDTSVVTPPLRSTYGFIGWFDVDDNEWREGDQLTGDISVYATYEQFDYNVYINVDSETLPINKSVLQGKSFNSTYPSFLPPLKYGYVVMDYYKADNININLPLDELNGLTLDELFTSGTTLQASQLVTNGDFSDGTTGWSLISVTGSVLNGIYSFTATETNGRLVQSISITQNDKIYYNSRIKTNSNNVKVATDGINLVAHTGSGNFENLSKIATITYGSVFQLQIRDFRTSAWTEIQVDYAYVFNISTLISNKQYSPISNTTFDLMTDAQIKTQMDTWVNQGLDTVINSLDILGAYSTAVAENWDTYYELYQEGLAGLFTTPALYEVYDMDEPINEDTYLYIMWELGLFTISFNSNGGSIVSTIAQLYDTPVNAPAPPTRTGYTFGGWYTETGLLNPYTFTTMSGENIILYAKWSINYYDVTFNANGGTPVAPINDVMYNTGIDKPDDPTREFYNFNGWYISDKLIKRFNFDTGVITDDTVLYAKWTPDILHGIDTNLDGTFLGTTLGKTIMVLVITAVVVIALGIFHAPMPVILVMLVMLLILFVTFGWIPIWLIILVAVILFLLLMFTTFGSKSSD
jgi:uncharacterized repeat protein (TIGR02543 family)